MKNKLFFFLAIIVISFRVAKAQTGLAFVQVKLFEIGTASSNTLVISVPAGKVWKIESVSMGSSGAAPNVFLKNANGQNIAFFASPVLTTAAAFPYWLPTGFTGTFQNLNPTYRCSVSVTEYTVTP